MPGLDAFHILMSRMNRNHLSTKEVKMSFYKGLLEKMKQGRCALLVIITLSSVLFIIGCGSTIGKAPHSIQTQTQLNQKNFKVISTGVEGFAYCYYLFNVIPLRNKSLYKMAMNEIRGKVKGDGKPVSLINVTEDVSTVTYFLFSKVELTLTADVVEFIN